MPTDLPDFEEDSFTQPMAVDDQIRTYLTGIAKWSNFLAIVGFVGVAFLVVMAFFVGTFFSMFLPSDFDLPIPIAGYAALYLIMAILYFFPILYLYRFATHLKKALKDNDQNSLTSAFSHLNAHYRFIGIMVAVGLILYAGLLVLAFLAFLMSGIL